MEIILKDITKSYEDAGHPLTILSSVRHTFADGKAFAIVGPSGIGKSTLLNIIAGLDKPTTGQVLYDEQDLTSFSEDRAADFRGASIGFVFQFHHLLPEFTAQENVAMPLLLVGQPHAASLQVAAEFLRRVGLGDRLHHRPSQLSGGEQQRVAIARAVVRRPKVLLADEPTGNLDVASAEQVRGLLRELQSELGSTLICVTHSKELAATMDHVLEMQPGGLMKAVLTTA